MRPLAPLAALATAALLAGCPAPPTPAPPGPAGVAPAASSPAPPDDLARVRAFLAALGPERTTLHSASPGDGAAAATFAWLDRAITRTKVGAYAYHLARVDGGSDAYALRRAAAQQKLEPLPGKAYVTVRFQPDGLACPEYHGVIDPDAPSLLAFWGEGG